MLSRSSHELKTPLMLIKGYTDLLSLRSEATLQDYELSLVDQIKKGCKRLEILINNILHKIELKSFKGKIEKVSSDLSSLINSCSSELMGFARLRGHELKLNIHDSLITSFDKEQITHVINNILSNAIKYTPPNGVIEISSRIDHGFIIIAISDSGIGFTKDEKKKVFTQFGKIERCGQGFDIIRDSSGFGLYIAKKVIDLHDGKIWLESEGRNKGSTFYFRLPKINN